jgi:hypothetical protein
MHQGDEKGVAILVERSEKNLGREVKYEVK